MAEDLIRYSELVERALRGVVRETLRRVAKEGLPGEHHFYITCRTGTGGLVLPPRLAARYPEEITIVIQNQFWDLVIGEEQFDITLTFGGVPEKLRVPFAAITAFFDPAVSFGLHFQAGTASATGAQVPAVTQAADETPDDEPDDGGPTENVVKLDAFRKA